MDVQDTLGLRGYRLSWLISIAALLFSFLCGLAAPSSSLAIPIPLHFFFGDGRLQSTHFRTDRHSHTEPYVYDPLTPGKIRLIHLANGSGGSDLHVELVDAPLHNCPDYTAISYVWGNATQTERVSINGKYLEVTRNLWSCLSCVAAKLNANESCLLWADAICIDQQDELEKSEQFPLFPHIYTGSHRVLCWLGEDTDKTATAAFEFLHKRSCIDRDEDRLLNSDGSGKEFLPQPSTGGEVLEDIGVVRSVLERPYFKRAWTLQEACQTRGGHPLVMIGNAEISWSALSAGCAWLLNHYPSIFDDSLMHILTTLGMYDLDRDSARLTNLIPMSSHRECSDERDRLFSLYGIATRHGIEYPKPNYTWSTEQAFVACTRAALQGDSTLALLSQVARPRGDAAYPSWSVKPWRMQGDLPPLWSITAARATCPYRSTLDTKPELGDDSSTDNTLRIRGVTFDYVAQVYNMEPFLQALGACSVVWEDMYELLEVLAEVMDLSEIYVTTGERCTAALARALLADRPMHTDEFLDTQLLASANLPAPDTISMDIETVVTEAATTTHRDQVGTDAQSLDKPAYLHEWSAENSLEYVTDPFDHPWSHMRTSSWTSIDSSWSPRYASHDFIEHEMADKLRKTILSHCRNKEHGGRSRTLVRTGSGLIGLAPENVNVGDRIVGLIGGQTSFVLRPLDPDRHELVGDCYVHGLMDGEGMIDVDIATDGTWFTIA